MGDWHTLIPLYIEIGQPGAIALIMMRRSLDNAARAMAAGDLVEMSGRNGDYHLVDCPHYKPALAALRDAP